MANTLTVVYRNNLLGGGAHPGYVDWNADTIKFHLIDGADHTFNATTNEDEADITNAAIVATGTLANVTIGSVAAGTVDADNTTLSSVTGDQSEYIVFWKDTGTDTTSPLLIMMDTFASGMPVTPNGGDIVFSWNASGIAQIGAGS